MLKDLNWEYDTNYNFYIVDSIPSTNTYLKENSDLYSDRTVLIALRQTAGRGRYDRVWKSDNDIIFSILLKNNGFYQITAPLAVCYGLLDLGFDVSIKWPNDIYLNGKKLVGILIEDIFRDKFISSVVGIGINLTDKPSFHAAYLNTDISKYLIIDKILKRFDEFNKKDFNYLMELYKSKSMILGKTVYFHDVEYQAIGIDNQGYLILRNDKEEKKISWDEINIKESLR